tara:strand:- start:68 stop:463 length:396 start_codon:yes stop_codon:yes gene_type:complete
MDYRNTDEKNYFGADLNKYANENCSKQMTIINIDYLSYKRSKKTIRIIESKHSSEGMPKSQREVLEIFASIFKKLNKSIVIFDYTFECYVVRGDFPYEIVEVEDLVNNTKFKLDNKNLKQFLEFEDYEIHS